MNDDSLACDTPRYLEFIYKDHLDNTLECGQALSQLFSNLNEPDVYIERVKSLEEIGDKLTAEAYSALELITHLELNHLAELFIKRLDDIVDGMNDTARLIDICMPKRIEDAAMELTAILLSMLAMLNDEIAQYPNNELASITDSRQALKWREEKADLVYHEWRKLQRRSNTLPLVDEANWTEILGNLEQTTDATYHAMLLLERMVKCRLRA